MKEIKLKSQPKWLVRMFILVGAILGVVFAFLSHPMGETSANNPDGTSDFMHYEIVDGIGTISVCDPDDSSKCITMRDRNEGATSAGTRCRKIGPCGNHFQWGNNYGFEMGCWGNGCYDNLGRSAVTTLATWLSQYNHTGYYGTTFIKGTSNSNYDYWSDNTPENHNGLWGGENDSVDNDYGYPVTNPTERKGPCPDGYHVPSAGERGMLVKYWTDNYVKNGNTMILSGDAPLYYIEDAHATNQFKTDFYISFAGYRGALNANLCDHGTTSVSANPASYMRSSSTSGSDAFSFRVFDSKGYNWHGVIDVSKTAWRTYGYSIRCFKDSYLSFPLCSQGQHTEDGETCIDNTKTVTCLTGNATGVAYNEQEVTITYDTGTETWESIPNCEVVGCADGYHTGMLLSYETVDGIGTITVCDQNNPISCITMQDKNLGADVAGTGVSSYGYYYQRGNNYGFLGYEEVKYDTINTIGFGPGNYYLNNKFIVTGFGPDWSNPSNDNLRGGSGDYINNNQGYDIGENTTITGRQGPCPDGYHIPSSQDRSKLLEYRTNNKVNLQFSNGTYGFTNTSVSNNFTEIFKLPLNGYLSSYDYTFRKKNIASQVRSSSPTTDSRAYVLNINTNEGITIIEGGQRGYARPIRCFKNFSLNQSAAVFSCEQNQKSEACVETGAPANASYITGNTTRTRNSGTNSWNIPACSWSCNPHYHTGLNNDTCEIDTYMVTWVDGNGDTLKSDTLDYGDMPTYDGAIPTKTATEQYTYIWNNSWSPSILPATANATYTAQFDSTVNKYEITFVDRDGAAIKDTAEYDYGTLAPVIAPINIPERDATVQYSYTFAGWEPSIHAVTGVQTYTATYTSTPNPYTVTFVDSNGVEADVVWTGDYGSETSGNVDFPLWTRNGYTLSWSRDIPDVVPAENIVITAIWTKKRSGGNGGGGGSSLKKDNCPDGDYSDSYYDGTCGKKPNEKDDEKDSPAKPQNDAGTTENDNNKHNSADEIVYDTLAFNPHYSDDMNKAYQYSYHYGITTKNNIRDAAVNQQLTRIAMAKMLSQYAINVLGIKPDATRNNEFADVSDKLDTEYGDGVTLAYQLGIMGINMPNNKFRPYGYVTRAEFATALSRLLYNTSDGEFEKTSKYYVPHINKLVYEGILTNTDPYMKELRGYVMLMLMRSAK